MVCGTLQGMLLTGLPHQCSASPYQTVLKDKLKTVPGLLDLVLRD